MAWQQWVLVAYLFIVMIAGIATIGENRKPTTAGGVALGTIVILGLIALVVTI